MRVCIILHNMIEREASTQFDTRTFEHGEGSGTSEVDMTYSTYMPTNLNNLLGKRNEVRDKKNT